jgi:hypothetical protein
MDLVQPAQVPLMVTVPGWLAVAVSVPLRVPDLPSGVVVAVPVLFCHA